MTGLRRALVGLGIAGFIAGAVPLVLALSAPDINDPELIAVFGPLVGWSFIGTGLFASLLPYLLEFHALKRLRSAVFGVLVSVEPAIATAVGFLVLGQAVGLWAVLAMVLVISASVGTTLSR